MKQTAVEWLIDEMNNIKGSSTNMNGKVQFLEKELNNLFEQAKEMEKEQIIESFSHGVINHHDAFKNENKFGNGDNYYNETFKLKKQSYQDKMRDKINKAKSRIKRNNKWDKLHKELDEALDSEFGKAKVALREYLLENKEKVAADLDEMREKSNQNKMKEEIDEFLDKLYALCWEYHIEIKPTHPVPNDEYPTISIINGDEVVKLLYVDGDGKNYYNETFKSE